MPPILHRAGPAARIATLAVVATLASGCRTAAPAPAPGSAVGSAAADPLLGPGDVVRVRIAYEPELSGDFTVDETGAAVLPMLGAVPVVSRSASALRADLASRYARYLRNAAVEVTPLRRVTVLGAVRAPGLYSADLTTSVGEALALAGGVGPDGDPNRVELLRGGRRVATSLARGARLGDLELRSGDQLYVRERGWLTRNAGLAATVVSGLVTLAVVLAAR